MFPNTVNQILTSIYYKPGRGIINLYVVSKPGVKLGYKIKKCIQNMELCKNHVKTCNMAYIGIVSYGCEIILKLNFPGFFQNMKTLYVIARAVNMYTTKSASLHESAVRSKPDIRH